MQYTPCDVKKIDVGRLRAGELSSTRLQRSVLLIEVHHEGKCEAVLNAMRASSQQPSRLTQHSTASSPEPHYPPPFSVSLLLGLVHEHGAQRNSAQMTTNECNRSWAEPHLDAASLLHHVAMSFSAASTSCPPDSPLNDDANRASERKANATGLMTTTSESRRKASSRENFLFQSEHLSFSLSLPLSLDDTQHYFSSWIVLLLKSRTESGE